MVKKYDIKSSQSKDIVFIYLLFGIILLYPDSAKGFLIYIPQFIIGVISAYLVLKISINKIIKLFFIFAIYMTTMNIILSTINTGSNIGDILLSSLRLYYPSIGLIIGSWVKKKVNPISLLKILTFFLVLQFTVSILQINHEGFRIWSYTLYRSNNLELYLDAFSWETGKRVIGTIGNPNVLGLLAVLFNNTILVLSEYIKSSKFRRLIIVTSIISSLYIVIYTQSRTAILLWVLTIILSTYMNYTKTVLTSIFYSLIAIIIGIMLLKTIGNSISREINIEGLDSRFDIWALQMKQMFQQSKYFNFFTSILGIGYKTTRDLGTFDNMYLKYFVSGGIVGFTIFLKTIIDTAIFIFRKSSNDILNQLGKLVLVLWVVGSFVAEYQENFKLSIVTFIILGYSLYSNFNEKNIIS